MTSSQIYQHFGLTIASEISLPLENADIDPARVDIRVCRGHVPLSGQLQWRSQIGAPSAYYESPTLRVLDMDIARFALTDDGIVMDGEVCSRSIQLLLFPVWAALLVLRGKEPLHGAVVERENKGFALFGSSGSGKTTGALFLIDQGWRLVTDDLIAFDDNGRVLPGPTFMRLRADRVMGRDVRPDGAGKHRLLPPRASSPVDLVAAVVLTPTVSEPKRLSGMEAVEALLTTPYNVLPVDPNQARNWFTTSLALARRIPIYGAPPRMLTSGELLQMTER